MSGNDNKTIFDLMFFGCQSINESQAKEVLGAIKNGKIKGVTYDKQTKDTSSTKEA